jgi:hypothetical protein
MINEIRKYMNHFKKIYYFKIKWQADKHYKIQDFHLMKIKLLILVIIKMYFKKIYWMIVKKENQFHFVSFNLFILI